jgi:hypothetical protein
VTSHRVDIIKEVRSMLSRVRPTDGASAHSSSECVLIQLHSIDQLPV